MSFKTLPVKKIRPEATLPIRTTDNAVGYDVFASTAFRVDRADDQRKIQEEIPFPVTINPHESFLFGIGIAMALPWPYECQVRSRSGIATYDKIQMLNSPGTVDPDFRGEAGVLLFNQGSKPYLVHPNQRIAQLIFSKVEIPDLIETDELPETRRAEGGFGSTGQFGTGLGTEEYRRRQSIIDQQFMAMAEACGLRARISSSQKSSGCVIVHRDNIIAFGCENCALSFTPISCILDAITKAARAGHSTHDSCAYVTADEISIVDLNLLIYSGITEVVFPAATTEKAVTQKIVKHLSKVNIEVRYA
ncbi:TPA: dUTP diphosphatase [Candidatus Falkowbacteria bacterium]|nr:dUTP diphosphatase [Candidatus Falkowbacteria bacterium]